MTDTDRPLDGLDAEEAGHLQRLAERNGLTVEQARELRDRADARVIEALQPLRPWIQDMAAAERVTVPMMRAAGVPVTGIGTATMAAAAGHEAIMGGGKGGKASKRRAWAERAAERVTSWEDLPTSNAAWEFEDLLVTVYRDGDRICAADIDDIDAEPKTLARSTFERRYLRK